LRIEAVIRDDHDEAARRERLADEEIVGFRAALPFAAIEEHDDRLGLAIVVRRTVDVEHLARVVAVVLIGDEAKLIV
jgi:hypothetical protein